MLRMYYLLLSIIVNALQKGAEVEDSLGNDVSAKYHKLNCIPTALMAFLATRRLFQQCTNRAIVYSQNGDPSKVLTALTYPSLPPPTSNTLNVQFILAPINPADLNVVEGVYPAKPALDASFASSGKGSKDDPVFVGGNEGLARITAVGDGVSGFHADDWVVMTKAQLGTWCTSKNVGADDVVKVPRVAGLSEVHAATMTVRSRGPTRSPKLSTSNR